MTSFIRNARRLTGRRLAIVKNFIILVVMLSMWQIPAPWLADGLKVGFDHAHSPDLVIKNLRLKVQVNWMTTGIIIISFCYLRYLHQISHCKLHSLSYKCAKF